MKIVILSDMHRGSYHILGNFYEQCIKEICEVTHLPTPSNQNDRRSLNYSGAIVLHNTLGEGFVPILGCHNIAMPLHEWSEYPPDWIFLLNQFEEIWTSTDHIGEVLCKGVLKPPRFLLPPPLDCEDIQTKKNWNLLKNPRFLALGESHFRKGHHLLIKGFLKAFPQEGQAQLTINTSPSCSWSNPRKDIIIIKDDWSREKLLAEYSRHDCFISASLGEGLGLPVAEAIMAELPICTNFWGGHKSLLTTNGFIEIPHEEIIQPFTSDPAFYAVNQKCAYSSPENIKITLKKFLKTSPTERKELTQIAKKNFLKIYGRENAVKNIKSRLEEINQK
jgi:glycosyltransferase involved in cell wall biosynthesis